MLQLNGIQHYAYCPRRWALITIEQVWQDNADTMIGQYVHRNVDNPFYEEIFNNKIISRSVPVFSYKLGINGIIDVLEFHRDSKGVELTGHEGYWRPFIVEYKKGRPAKQRADQLQVVAQAFCLEEMYDICITEAAIYYVKLKKREKFYINDSMKSEVKQIVQHMHALINEGKTPGAEIKKNCQLCSLKDLCMPRLTIRKRSVANYISNSWEIYNEEIPE